MMWKKKIISLCISMLVLVGLGSFAIWLSNVHTPQKEKAEALEKKVLGLKDQKVKSIVLVGDGKRFEFRCLELDKGLCKPGDQSKWEILQPIRSKADTANVNALLSSLNSMNSSEKIDLTSESPERKGELLAEYELSEVKRKDPGFKRFEVLTDSGGTKTAYIGSVNPVGNTTYVVTAEEGKPASSVVLLVPSYSVKTQFDHDLTYWRDKKLFSISGSELSSFDLKGTKASLSAEKKEGKWVIHPRKESSQKEIPGDPESIDGMLSSVTGFSAKTIVAEGKDSGAGKAALTGFKKAVTLELTRSKEATKETRTLVLFEGTKGKEKKIYATVSDLDPVFELNTIDRDRIDKALKELRVSKLISAMDRYGAKRVQIEGKPLGPTPIVAVINKDGKWSYEKAGAELDLPKFNRFLDQLSSNRISRFLPAGPPGSPTSREQGGVEVTIGDEKLEKKKSFLFWKVGADLYAKDVQGKVPEVYALDKSVQDAFPWKSDFFNKAPEAKPSPLPTQASTN